MIVSYLLFGLQAITPKQAVTALDAALRSEEVRAYSLYVVDPRALLRSAMTPERIRKAFDASISRQTSFPAARMKSFAAALRGTKFEEVAQSVDVRYGLSIRDSHDKEILWICMSHDARLAVIGGHVYRTKGNLGGWFSRAGRDLLNSP